MALAIDNSASLRYESLLRNDLTTAVGFVLGGTALSAAGTVTFAAPTSGTTATGTPILENGAIVGVTITNPGTGYTTAPTATFSAANVTGTTAITGDGVTAVNITNSGGRTLAITDLTIYPSGDSRAALNAEVFDKFGHVARVSITSGSAVTFPLGNYRLVIGDDGLQSVVTITSTLKKLKDGTAFHIGTVNTFGAYTMEK